MVLGATEGRVHHTHSLCHQKGTWLSLPVVLALSLRLWDSARGSTFPQRVGQDGLGPGLTLMTSNTCHWR